MRDLSVELKDFNVEYLDLAVTRLSYLYQKLNFERKVNSIIVTGPIDDKENIKKEINFAVYREKIYAENLEIRKKIFEEI